MNNFSVTRERAMSLEPKTVRDTQTPVDRELLFDLKSGRTTPSTATPPTLSSASLRWDGVLVEEHSVPSVDVAEVCPVNHVVAICLNSNVELEWTSNGTGQRVMLQSGTVSLIPAGCIHSARVTSTCRYITVSLTPAFVAAAANAFPNGRPVQLRCLVGGQDGFLAGVAMALRQEVEKGGHGRLYGEALAVALAVHLVHHYAEEPVELNVPAGGLSQDRLRAVLRHIDLNLAEDLNLNALADRAGLSAYHFARMFKESTGTSPHQYVLRCRVEQARLLLQVSGGRVVDVALKVGFSDQGHLARHFKRAYGITPEVFLRTEVRRRRVPVRA